MGEEPAGSGLTADEAAFYRAVEDHFARLRGTPFLFTSRDFALLRRWWAEGVPLAAVLAGLGEVFERRAAADGDPVSSLSYCRHAISRHARRLAARPPAEAGVAAVDTAATLARLVAEVRDAVQRWQAHPSLAGELERVAAALASLSAASEPAALDEALARLELGVAEPLVAALPAAARARVAEAVANDLKGAVLAPEVRGRTERALRLRHLREVVGLPRLALDADGA